MFMKDWKKEVCTIPNLLSLFRLGLIPVYMTMYLRAATPQAHYWAGGILALSCITDFADGFIARTFHMTSRLGQFLDPLADKATQLALARCLSHRYRLLEPVLMLLILKESVQLLAGLFYLHRGNPFQGALMAGKCCTTVLFTSFLVLVILPNPQPGLIRFLAAGDFACLLYAFASYLLTFLGIHWTDFKATK